MNSKVQDWHWWEIIVLVALVAAAPVIYQQVNSKVLLLILCALSLIGFHYFASLSTSLKRAYAGFLVVIVLALGMNSIDVMRQNVENPPEWDLRWFWVFGKVAAQGDNFYKPEYSHELAALSEPSDDFKEELYFWYPPPSMLFIAPLGWFDVQTAVVFWYAINSVSFIGCVYLLWKIFLPENGWIGFLWVFAFLLLFQPTITTILYGQTNFLALFLILIFWQTRERVVGGVPLALAVFVKLYIGVLFFYLILKRKWKILASTLVSMLVISLITLLIFGSDTFFGYFTENPNSHTPDYLYTETINQSLLATILRTTQYDISGRSPLMNPIFIGAALILSGITVWAVISVKKRYQDLPILLILLLGLLIYPASLEHYGVMLALPLLYFWQYRKELPGKPVGIFILMMIIVGMSTIGNNQFYANLFTWLVLVAMSWKISQDKTDVINQSLSFERK